MDNAMNLKVYYEEVTNYTERYYAVRPQLKRIDDKTLEVSFQPGRFIPPIVFQLRIEAMRKDVVCMSYECSTSVAMLVAGFVKHIGNKLPRGIDVKAVDKRINLYPERVKGARLLMEHAQLDGVHICEDRIAFVVSMK